MALGGRAQAFLDPADMIEEGERSLAHLVHRAGSDIFDMRHPAPLGFGASEGLIDDP